MNKPDTKQFNQLGSDDFLAHHFNNSMMIIDSCRIMLREHGYSNTMIEDIKTNIDRIQKAIEIYERAYNG